MASIRQRPWWPGAAVGAATLGVTASVTEPLLLGGLAPLAVAAVVAAVVGVPVARVEWRHRPDLTRPADFAVLSLGETVFLAWLAALWATAWPGLTGGAAGALLWAVAFAIVRARGDVAVVSLAALCVLQVSLAAGLGWLEAAPWTLLQPQWSSWTDWLPWSLVSGLLLAAAGVLHWSRGPEAPPGTGHVPWLPAGMGLVVALGTACRAGSRFEADLGLHVDALALGIGTLGIMTAASAALAVAPSGSGRQALLGAGATVWFAGPGSGALPWMFGVYLPVGILFVLGHRASQLSGLARWTCLAGAALGGTSAALGFPGVPESPPEAVGAALTGVALLWVAGTRSLLEDR